MKADVMDIGEDNAAILLALLAEDSAAGDRCATAVLESWIGVKHAALARWFARGPVALIPEVCCGA
ncbi:MAG TPA: hypothetical protein VK530_03080 [Candidatus Acidoferrum sp.]|nr:hypothetical protein [Candidatus Acidoferrum sp.]